MKKTLIRCPRCESFGKKRTLALVLENGELSIQRALAKGRRDYTIVCGNNFEVKCGDCGETAFIRKEENGTPGDFWGFRFHRETFIGSIGTVLCAR